MENNQHLRSIRSFVRREGRLTSGQREALDILWPRYGLEDEVALQKFLIETADSEQVLDIGFGDGAALVELAREYPKYWFVGVEVYRPGIGSLLRKLEDAGVSNVRVINADAVELLGNIKPHCLSAITLWFPDPWPKKRHHKRRIVQSSFIELAREALNEKGVLHIATDWVPYAEHIKAEMSAAKGWEPLTDAAHPAYFDRPHSKFELRGQRLGHAIEDLRYQVS